MRVTIDSQIWIPPDVPEVVHDALHDRTTHQNPEWIFRKRTNRWMGDCPRDIVIATTDDEGWTHVPRGLAPLVRELMDEHVGDGWEWEDKRVSIPLTEPLEFHEQAPPGYSGQIKVEGIKLFDFQKQIAEETERWQNLLVRAPGASGKTVAGVYTISHLMQRAMVVVWDSAIHAQWVATIERFLDITPRVIGGGARWTHPDSSPVTVAMQQTLARSGRARQEAPHFGLVILDECQRAPASTFEAVLSEFPAKHMLGISESEDRKDGLQFMTHAFYGEPRVEIPRGMLVDLGRIEQVDFVVVETDWTLKDEEGHPLISSDFEPDDLRKEMIAATDRTMAIVDDVEREALDGRCCLVLVRWKDMGRQIKAELWRRGVDCGLLFGGTEMAEEFETTVRKLKSGEWKVGIGTQKVYTGFDVPNIERVFNTTPSATNRPLLGQQVSRAARVAKDGKERPVFFYYWDHKVYRHHGRLLRKFFRDEPERFNRTLIRTSDGATKVYR